MMYPYVFLFYRNGALHKNVIFLGEIDTCPIIYHENLFGAMYLGRICFSLYDISNRN